MRLAKLAPVLFALTATACVQLDADDTPGPGGG